MGLFSSKSKTTTLEPMLTNEQKQAMALLQQFGATGQLGDFQAGQQYDFGGFDFAPTRSEVLGGEELNKLLTSGTGADMSMASKTLRDIAGQTFNPDDPSSGFAAYSRQVARAGKQASDVLNREAAITGGRFGTGIQRQKADLAAQQSDVLASKLADLYQQTQAQKLSAAGGLADIAQAQEAINQNRIQAAYTYGARQREIQNQKAQAQYDDWQRARTERLSSIGSMSNVMGANVNWGVKSATTKSPSTLMAMMGEFMPGVGSYNTHQYGYTTNQTSINQTMQDLAKMYSGGK